MKHVNLTIQGKVQGVFFRKHTQEKAEELGINGFVKNQSDGSVYAEAEGEDSKIDQFVAWCHKGPSRAEVTDVHTNDGSVKGLKGFKITY